MESKQCRRYELYVAPIIVCDDCLPMEGIAIAIWVFIWVIIYLEHLVANLLQGSRAMTLDGHTV